jgi:hypothetical protein
MGRYLLACALLLSLLGCSKPEASKPGGSPGKPMTMPTPATENGDGPPENELPKALDLPLFPGAKITKNRTATSTGAIGYHITLETSESVQKVADFYQSNGIPCSVKNGAAEGYGPTKHGKMAIISASHTGDKTEITIKVRAE